MKGKTIQSFLLIFLTSFAMVCISCGGDDSTAGKGSFAIVTSEDAALRIDPILFSARITLLARGTAVEICDRSEEKTWIGNTSDYWYRIRMNNGITGWLFGQNIRMLKTNKKDEVVSLVSKYWEDEADLVRPAIAGRWWSTDKTREFSNHCLELTADGHYRSYTKGQDTESITGDYSINVEKHEIIFNGKTSFNTRLFYNKLGKMYKLTDDRNMSFKKTSDKVDLSVEVNQVEKDNAAVSAPSEIKNDEADADKRGKEQQQAGGAVVNKGDSANKDAGTNQAGTGKSLNAKENTPQ